MELLSQAIHVRLPSTRVQFTGTRDALKEGGILKTRTRVESAHVKWVFDDNVSNNYIIHARVLGA